MSRKYAFDIYDIAYEYVSSLTSIMGVSNPMDVCGSDDWWSLMNDLCNYCLLSRRNRHGFTIRTLADRMPAVEDELYSLEHDYVSRILKRIGMCIGYHTLDDMMSYTFNVDYVLVLTINEHPVIPDAEQDIYLQEAYDAKLRRLTWQD